MGNILWIMAGANLVYLIYALFKNRKKTLTESLADQVRILTVPEQHLSLRPIAKSYNIKETTGQEGQWWEKKIQGSQGKNSGRRNHEPEQLFLSDTDSILR